MNNLQKNKTKKIIIEINVRICDIKVDLCEKNKKPANKNVLK